MHDGCEPHRQAIWVMICLLTSLALSTQARGQSATQSGSGVERYVTRYGGVHEFGVWVGYSPVSGPLWG